ncbi:MAG: BamA/TamA family outer membrane protein [Chitinophagaceae bacterium]
MFPDRLPINKNLLHVSLTGLFIIAFASCTIVKKYQHDKPFVYKTNINLIGNFSNEEKEVLTTGLEGQLDDSMNVRKLDKLFWSVLKTPPVYDSANADKSIVFMRALMKSQGYFNDSIYFTHDIDTVGRHQLRTIVDFYVRPGKLYRLDTVVYNIRQPELQHLTDSTRGSALVKKGDPFAKGLIAAERERLTDLYRNNGYLRFNSEELIGLWDTVDVALLQPTFDPFEQLEILQKLRERRENPTADLEIRLKTADSLRLVKYYIGNVTIYPDNVPDTSGLPRKERIVEDITVVQHRNRFKAKIFPPNIYLPRGSVYSQQRYFRTLNRFNSLGTWRLVSIDQFPRAGQDTVDFVIRLTPAPKYAFNTNIEGSINQSVISGNLLGLGLNVGLQNRNFAKSASIANTNIRYGIELGNRGSNQFIQSEQRSLTHNIYFPRFIPNLRLVPERFRDNFKTLFSFNATNTERRLLYNLTSINGSFGHEFQRRNVLITSKLLNIEYSYLIKRDSLDTLIKYNPSLNNIFTDGFIASFIGGLTISGGTSNRLNVLRLNAEEAGLITGMFRSPFLDKELYRFIKFDAEFARLVRFPKSSIAMRGFFGIGYEYNSTRNAAKRNNLPFFKQFFSGGPNSMRAWALRRLGPGSSIKEFSGQGSTPDRYGDVQLESNLEYRFPIGKPFGIFVNGALFTDVGNVWFLKKAQDRPAEEVFKLSRLGKDIAVGAGAGLRVDLSFLVIRLDYAYKVKDPSPTPANAALQNKWFGYKFFDGDQFQLGINYPFIF